MDVLRMLNQKDTIIKDEIIEKSIKKNSLSQDFQLKYKFKKIIGVTTMNVDGMKTYIFNKRISNQKAIIYLHGGFSIKGPQKYHFEFLENLILNTNACIIMPIYPRLPVTYENLFRLLHKGYEMVQKYYFHEITIMGDGSGASLALSFSADAIARGLKPLDHTILISPWLDLALSNPKIDGLEKNDVILRKEGLKKIANMWAKGTDLTDYLLSPLYAPLEGIKGISLYIGENEIFYPDTQLFADRCNREGVNLDMIIGENLGHNFPLYPIKSVRDYRRHIYKTVNFNIPHFSVKVASNDDVDELERMLDEANMKYNLFDNRVDNPFINLVIKENEQIVAGLSACFTCFSIVFLQTLVVDSDFRELGLGTKLIKQMEFIAQTKGANIIRADAFNFQGKRFFEKMGYKCVGKYTHKTDNFSEFFYIKEL